MASSQQEQQRTDPRYIDLSDPEDVIRWRQTFGVTEEELRAAVRAAGTSADRVLEALRARPA